MKTCLEIAREYQLNGELFEKFVLHKKLPHTRNENGEVCILADDVARHVALYEKALTEAGKRQEKGGGVTEGALRIIGVFSIAAAILYGAVGGAEGLLLIGLPAVIFATVLFAIAEIVTLQRKTLAVQEEILKKLK